MGDAFAVWAAAVRTPPLATSRSPAAAGVHVADGVRDVHRHTREAASRSGLPAGRGLSCNRFFRFDAAADSAWRAALRAAKQQRDRGVPSLRSARGSSAVGTRRPDPVGISTRPVDRILNGAIDWSGPGADPWRVHLFRDRSPGRVRFADPSSRAELRIRCVAR
jgi:hypothetical protein